MCLLASPVDRKDSDTTASAHFSETRSFRSNAAKHLAVIVRSRSPNRDSSRVDPPRHLNLIRARAPAKRPSFTCNGGQHELHGVMGKRRQSAGSASPTCTCLSWVLATANIGNLIALVRAESLASYVNTGK